MTWKLTDSKWASLSVALTMAHLLTWRNWSLLLGPSPQHFLMPAPLPSMAILTLGIWMILLSGLVYGLLEFPHIKDSWRAAVWTALTIYFLASLGRGLATQILPFIRHTPAGFKLVLKFLAVPALLIGIWAIGWTRWFVGTRQLVAFCFALPLVLWGQLIVQHGAFYTNPPPKAVRPASLSHSTWILVFDELDYRLTLGESSGRVALPEFLRFQQESTSLTRATPPSMMTISAIPSLLLGRSFRSTHPLDARTLLLNPESGAASVKWRGEGSLFHDLDHRGRSLAVMGFHLPYDRLLCDTSASVFEDFTTESAFQVDRHRQLIRSFLSHVTESLPIASATPDWDTSSEYHRQILQRMTKHLETLTTVPRRDYYWLHLPIPHAPSLVHGGSYLDNLQAADRLFGAFRRSLETNGLWDSSTVIILGDHWLRNPIEIGMKTPLSWVAPVTDRWATSDHRTVFMVRLPGQKDARSFHTPINTAVLHRLVLALDSGSIKQPKDLRPWLDEHRNDIPVISSYESPMGVASR